MERPVLHSAVAGGRSRELNTTPERVAVLFATSDEALAIVLEAHQRTATAVKAASPGTQVGITRRTTQAAPGGEALAAEIWSDIF